MPINDRVKLPETIFNPCLRMQRTPQSILVKEFVGGFIGFLFLSWAFIHCVCLSGHDHKNAHPLAALGIAMPFALVLTMAAFYKRVKNEAK